jgi:hypothetical protein
MPGDLCRYSEGLRAGRPGFNSGQGQNFPLLHSVQTGSVAHPAFCRMGTVGSFPGVKRPGREADHPPPSSVQIRNDGVIPPLPYTSSWRVPYLIEHEDNFTLHLIGR